MLHRLVVQRVELVLGQLIEIGYGLLQFRVHLLREHHVGRFHVVRLLEIVLNLSYPVNGGQGKVLGVHGLVGNGQRVLGVVQVLFEHVTGRDLQEVEVRLGRLSLLPDLPYHLFRGRLQDAFGARLLNVCTLGRPGVLNFAGQIAASVIQLR